MENSQVADYLDSGVKTVEELAREWDAHVAQVSKFTHDAADQWLFKNDAKLRKTWFAKQKIKGKSYV